MSKYDALTDALQNRPGSHWPVSFKEIEAVINASLPHSAYNYPAWWSNNPSKNVMTKAWLDAGWKTCDVDVPGQKVTFRKTGPAKPVENVGEQPAPVYNSGLTVTLSDADQNALAMIAAASGETIEETATRLLTQAIEIAAPSVRAGQARQALEGRSQLKAMDLDAIVGQARDMH